MCPYSSVLHDAGDGALGPFPDDRGGRQWLDEEYSNVHSNDASTSVLHDAGEGVLGPFLDDSGGGQWLDEESAPVGTNNIVAGPVGRGPCGRKGHCLGAPLCLVSGCAAAILVEWHHRAQIAHVPALTVGLEVPAQPAWLQVNIPAESKSPPVTNLVSHNSWVVGRTSQIQLALKSPHSPLSFKSTSLQRAHASQSQVSGCRSHVTNRGSHKSLLWPHTHSVNCDAVTTDTKQALGMFTHSYSTAPASDRTMQHCTVQYLAQAGPGCKTVLYSTCLGQGQVVMPCCTVLYCTVPAKEVGRGLCHLMQ